MKIERGVYVTTGGHTAWVSETKDNVAVGFLDSGGKIIPCAWNANLGRHQPGIGFSIPSYDIDAAKADPLTEPSDPQPLITGPGDYKDDLGCKIKIAATGSGYAFGVTPNGQLGQWCSVTGRKMVNGNPSLNGAIAGPWKEPPRSATRSMALVQRPDGKLMFVAELESGTKLGPVIGRKTVTITEGDGM